LRPENKHENQDCRPDGQRHVREVEDEQGPAAGMEQQKIDDIAVNDAVDQVAGRTPDDQGIAGGD
jgi:hypothetical protein